MQYNKIKIKLGTYIQSDYISFIITKPLGTLKIKTKLKTTTFCNNNVLCNNNIHIVTINKIKYLLTK